MSDAPGIPTTTRLSAIERARLRQAARLVGGSMSELLRRGGVALADEILRSAEGTAAPLEREAER